MTHQVQTDCTVSINILPVCFNILPGVWLHPLLQNRDIRILPPFGYATADRHSRMKLAEIPKQRNSLVHSNLCHSVPLKDSVAALLPVDIHTLKWFSKAYDREVLLSRELCCSILKNKVYQQLRNTCFVWFIHNDLHLSSNWLHN